MKKRLLAIGMATLMGFSLVACSSGSTESTKAESTEKAQESKDGEESTAAEEKKASTDLKIGMVTDVGGVNDGSFNQSAWEGLQRAQKELGIQAKYLESKTDADYIPNIETLVDDDYDLIICIGYQLADALRTEAEANPDKKFAIVDDASIELDNVACLMFEQAQASYLGVKVGSIFLAIANQERAKAGLSNEQVHDTSKAIETAVEAIRILIKKEQLK